jgi:TPR repeat protein
MHYACVRFAAVVGCVGLALLMGSAAWGGDFDICPQNNPARHTFRPGSAEAEFCLGFAYATGRGVAKGMAQAIRHYRNAAEQGYAPAQAMLGLHFDQGGANQ